MTVDFQTHPARQVFEEKLKQGQNQIVWRWLPADLETPVAAFLKLCGDNPYSFLLESIEGGAKLGRYSVIGTAPDLLWSCTDGKAHISHLKDGSEKACQDPLNTLQSLLDQSHIATPDPALPPMAVSGLFGYMGYDMIRLVEKIPQSNPDPTDIADAVLMRPGLLAIFDHVRNMICLVAPVYAGGISYDEAIQKLTDAACLLSQGIPPSLLATKTQIANRPEPSSNIGKRRFLDSIGKAKEHIAKGDIFQVVLSQRFSAPFDLPPFCLYRALRILNPSPFLFFFRFDGFSLVGSSPEILVRVRKGIVTIRPIAGTRKRGETEEEDKALAAELLADPKECAEHLMLLDLGRNDVGRIAEYGSVKVTDKFAIERYSHVMHIVSNVEGVLRKGVSVLEAMFSGFPAGTVTGAPKIRAMQIIDDLENLKRGYYGGAAGYFSGGNEMDTCITLRTALVKDGALHVQAGAGIVADSNPEMEYQETVNKAAAIFKAADLALDLARNEPLLRRN